MKFAQIDQISFINPIEGADSIEIATVQGWDCIVKKGEYNIGDKCVFIFVDTEMDSSDPVSVFSIKKDVVDG